MSDKPILTPELIARFAAYKASTWGGAWGALHVVLEDGNTDDADGCAEWARERGDAEGEALALLLEKMSGSQRGRIDRKVTQWEAKQKWAAQMATVRLGDPVLDVLAARVMAGERDRLTLLAIADRCEELGQEQSAAIWRRKAGGRP